MLNGLAAPAGSQVSRSVSTAGNCTSGVQTSISFVVSVHDPVGWNPGVLCRYYAEASPAALISIAAKRQLPELRVTADSANPRGSNAKLAAIACGIRGDLFPGSCGPSAHGAEQRASLTQSTGR